MKIKIKKKSLYRNIIWIVYMLYLFSIIVFSDREKLNIYSNVIFVVFEGLMVLYLVRYIKEFPRRLLYFIPFVSFCLLSALWSESPTTAIKRTITLAELVCLYMTLGFYLYITDEVAKYLLGFAISGLAVFAYILMFYGFDAIRLSMASQLRIGSEIVNENTLAIFLASSIIIFLDIYLWTHKILWVLPAVPLMALIALTGSKKGVLDVIIGIVLLLIMNKRDRNGKRTVLRRLVFVVVAFVILQFAWRLPIFGVVRDRFSRFTGFIGIGGARRDTSSEGRLLMIQGGLRQFLKTPLFGVGIGNTGSIALEAIGRETYLHCDYVELLASVGLVGFLLYYVPVFKLLKESFDRRYEGTSSKLCLTLLVIYMLNWLASVEYYSKTTYILFGICTANLMRRKGSILRRSALSNDESGSRK